MRKKLFPIMAIYGIFLISSPIYAADNTTLPVNVQQSLKVSKISPKSLSVAIVPLDTAGISTFYNADALVNPASNMKVITTYSSLELLGPNYRWATRVYTDGAVTNGVLNGNLYVKGGGDPNLTMEKLWLLLRDIKAKGIVHIKGDLVLDRSYFRPINSPAFHDDSNDTTKPYLVTPDALLVNLKTLRVVTSADNSGTRVNLEPPLQGVSVVNKVTASPAKKCSTWPNINYKKQNEGNKATITVSGRLPKGCTAETYMALLNHPAYAAGAIRGMWSELGGSITGQNRQAITPASARLITTAYSSDLTEIIRDINKFSNNTMAQQLFLSIGAKFRKPGDKNDAASAQRTIKSWMSRKGIDTKSLVMDNGAGLSRISRVSAREMSQILQAAWESPYAAEFMSSLPLAGIDGTMRKRLKNTPLRGQAHIKTGTLNNVRAISGFSRDRNGHTWAVVGILNDSRPWGAGSILDQILMNNYRNPKSQN